MTDTPGLVVFLCATVLLVGVAAEAQTLSKARPVQVEVAATVSGTEPEVTVVTCCELRTPERYSLTDRTFTTLAVGAMIRVLWKSRASTSVEIEWAPSERRVIDIPSPSSIPAPIVPGFPPTAVVAWTTERKGWALAAGQGIDLVQRPRWRATLSAGIVVERLQERYEQTSLVYSEPPRVGIYHSVRRETLGAGVGAIAVTAYVVPRVHHGRNEFSTVLHTRSTGP